MKVNLKTHKSMVMAVFIIQTKMFFKEDFKIIKNRVKGQNYILIKLNIQEIILIIKSMAMVSLFIKIKIIMQANLKMDLEMDKENTFFWMVLSNTFFKLKIIFQNFGKLVIG